MTVTIIGIKKMWNKDKTRLGTTVYYSQPFDDYSVDNAETLMGNMTASDFTYKNVDCKPGDEVELVYVRGFQNQATLADIRVIKPHTQK